MVLSASALYDYAVCSHRVWRDAHGPPDEKSQQESPFVRLLWEDGIRHEREIAARLGKCTDLSEGGFSERTDRTREEMEQGTPLIYRGILMTEDLLGMPDLLRLTEEGYYIPLDIKSGFGAGATRYGAADGKRMERYALPLALYSEILLKTGFSNERKGVILDITGGEVEYDLNMLKDCAEHIFWFEYYEHAKNEVKLLLEDRKRNFPAISGACRLCPWLNSCRSWCEKNSDLSLIYSLGAEARDILMRDAGAERVEDLVDLDIEALLRRKAEEDNFLCGIGKSRLRGFSNRAYVLIKKKAPAAYGKIEFPEADTELFLDIQDDPTRDFIYLHGVLKRDGAGGRFVYFFAVENAPGKEGESWAELWRYLQKHDIRECAVYYYSDQERNFLESLAKRHPDVAGEEEVLEFLGSENVIDLFDVVVKNTDWPLSSYSIKEIAEFLGFRWRCAPPAGAHPAEWLDEYMQTKDPAAYERIIKYNEDYCRAAMALKDWLDELPAGEGAVPLE